MAVSYYPILTKIPSPTPTPKKISMDANRKGRRLIGPELISVTRPKPLASIVTSTNSESGSMMSPQGKIDEMENSSYQHGDSLFDHWCYTNSTSVHIQYRVTGQMTMGTGWADLLPRYEPIRPVVILILLTRLLSVNIL